jgi:type IV pilus assembly protein PilE
MFDMEGMRSQDGVQLMEGNMSYSAKVACKKLPVSVQSGFSLLELLIAVAIIGILAAIAIPSYQDYVIRASLPDATSGLSAARARMEQYYQDNRDYQTKGAFTSPCASLAKSGKFSFECTAGPTATTYTITATGSGIVSDFSYSINQANDQKTVKAKSGWGASNSPCWLMNRGASC